ncbi:MAG TPA: acetolactate decarboxylase [Kiritimatiellia bacterium]|nr:acetolactate decarboxylase [Kiritimatiellia bacterium]
MKVLLRAWVAGVVLFMVGCQTVPPPTHRELNPNQVTIAGSYARLAEGGFGTQVRVGDLLEWGDFGLGTFEGLDGEMILDGGRMYRAALTGEVEPVAPEMGSPFAVVTWFDADRFVDLSNVTMTRFLGALNLQWGGDEHPIAIRTRGTFSWMVTRSVEAQEEPYPRLEAALAGQMESRLEEVEGIMVGYYFPASFRSFHPAGYHFHFITEDRSRGGHVVDFHLRQGRVELNAADQVTLILPRDVSPYRFGAREPRPVGALYAPAAR